MVYYFPIIKVNMNLFLLIQACDILFTADNHVTDHVSSAFPGS